MLERDNVLVMHQTQAKGLAASLEEEPLLLWTGRDTLRVFIALVFGYVMEQLRISSRKDRPLKPMLYWRGISVKLYFAVELHKISIQLL